MCCGVYNYYITLYLVNLYMKLSEKDKTSQNGVFFKLLQICQGYFTIFHFNINIMCLIRIVSMCYYPQGPVSMCSHNQSYFIFRSISYLFDHDFSIPGDR